MKDMVNHPDHYISESGIETIDVIKAFVADIDDPFAAYCTGNIIKYICRWPNKNGLQDLEKAQWYLNALTEYQKRSETEEASREIRSMCDEIEKLKQEISFNENVRLDYSDKNNLSVLLAENTKKMADAWTHMSRKAEDERD